MTSALIAPLPRSQGYPQSHDDGGLCFERDMVSRTVREMKNSSPNCVAIVSCSKRKLAAPGMLPAIQRYDGPAFRVLRRRLHPQVAAERVSILSAEFGLMAANEPIPDYDRVMTIARATMLRSEVSQCVLDLLSTRPRGSLTLFLGKNYLAALQPELLRDPRIRTVNGPIGVQLHALRCWCEHFAALPCAVSAGLLR